jgi:DEAD/DEAH box helicase domain-containing protein
MTPSEKLNGLKGMGNAMRAIGAMLLMCDPRDLGVALTEDIKEGWGSRMSASHHYSKKP